MQTSNHRLRTLNVVKVIPGIAEKLQVNVAYELQPGLTYGQAKAFERYLEEEIQGVLFNFTDQPAVGTEPVDEKIRFIPIEEALQIARIPTTKAFSNWKSRFNTKHPHAKIITKPNYVDIYSLRRALLIINEEVAA